MKKLITPLLVLCLFAGTAFGQAKKDDKQKPATEQAKVKKDGTPDKRFKENKKLKKDGTPDKRFKENKKN